MKKTFLILFFFIGISCFSLKAAQLTPDSIRISLLTCSPGDDIYTLFGHTGLRVSIPETQIDEVYHYGIFDFSSDHFVWRFALGQANYKLGKVPYDYFLYEYTYYGRAVWEQELRLSSEEKYKLLHALEDNYKPQNRVYRYNVLFDNCATKPLEKIEESTNREILLKSLSKDTPSFRDLIHLYTKNHPWSQFGIDLCLGSGADKPTTIKQRAFLPIELMKILEKTKIGSNPLTKPVKTILDEDKNSMTSSSLFIPSPLTVFTTLFILLFLISIWEYKRGKSFLCINTVLFTIYGIAGCILTFLALFSHHPTVSPNYLLFLFHPLHLIFALILAFKRFYSKKRAYHYTNLIILTLFIVFLWFIPQSFSLAILPLAGCLLLRSLTFILIQTKKQA